jgi:hypothetical protein
MLNGIAAKNTGEMRFSVLCNWVGLNDDFVQKALTTIG